MSAVGVPITGGCQCGAVRYMASAPLERASICHCRMCQKAFGSFYAPLVGVPVSQFRVTRGEVAIFRSSDVVERGFCRSCGTPLTFQFIGAEKIDVSIGSLDDPSLARPEIQFGVESMIPWVRELASLPGHTTESGGPADRVAEIARTNHQHPDHDTPSWP